MESEIESHYNNYIIKNLSVAFEGLEEGCSPTPSICLKNFTKKGYL